MGEHLVAIVNVDQRGANPGVGRGLRLPWIPWQLVPIAIVLLAVTLGVRWSPSPIAQSLSERLQPPFGLGGSWFGTDGLGRNLLARILLGARNSLVLSTIAATGAALIGIVVGVIAGFMGGWFDRIVTMLVETVLAVPFITVGLMVAATIGQSAKAVVLLLIATGWITHTRILRSQVKMLSASSFVLAAQSIGASRWHIMFRHIWPNVMPLSVVVFFQQIGSMILWSAALTWLGIGMPIDHISLGGIVRDGQDLLYNGWWVSVIGGLAIVFIVTALNLTADWIRLVLDPVTKGYR